MKILTLLLLGLLLLPIASAIEWDNIKTFTKNGGDKYGKIEIKNVWGLGGTLAEYKVTDNTDTCLFDCHAEGTVTINNPAPLFTQLEYINRQGKSKNLPSTKVYIYQDQTYTLDKPVWQKECKEVDDKVNKTKQTVCTQVQKGTTPETMIRSVPVEYSGTILPVGTYRWRIEAKKDAHESIDWIMTAQGVRMTEWLWWDATFLKKVQINITNSFATSLTNYSVKLEIPYNNSMQNDFGDLRFINSTETAELGYWNESQVNGINTTVWVFMPVLTPGVNTIWMYFNNTAATDHFNISQAFELGDQFIGTTLNPAYWTDISQGAGGSVSVANNKLLAQGAGGAIGAIKSNPSFSINYTMRALVNFTSPGAGQVKIIAFSSADGASPNKCGAMNDGHYVGSSGAASFGLRNWDGGTPSGFETLTQNADVFDTYDILRNSSYSSYAQRAYGVTTATNPNNYDLTSIPLCIAAEDQTPQNKVEVDWIYVRKFRSPEPTSVQSNPIQNNGVTVGFSFPDNATLVANNYINVSCNTTGIGSSALQNVTVYVNNKTNGALAYQNTAGISGTANSTIWQAGYFGDGNYEWYCRVYGNDGTTDVTTNRTFSIDTTPPVITITAPQQNSTISYHQSGRFLQLNWTVVDANTGSCWYAYNNSNVSVTCFANTTNINITDPNVRTILFYANDSLNKVQKNSTTWDYKVFDQRKIFNPLTYAGATETFIYNFSTTSSATVSSVILNYSGSLTYATVNNIGSLGKYASTTLYIAPPSSSGINRTIEWLVGFSDSSTVNSTNFTQEIRTIGLDNCAANTILIYNYTMLDEDDQFGLTGALYNTSIKVDLALYSLANTSIPVANFSTIFNKTNVSQVCVQTGVLNTTSYVASSIVQYLASQRVEEFLVTQNQSITNLTIPYNVKLFDLLTTRAQSFKISYKDQNSLVVPGVVVNVYRYYINEGVYKVVEAPITDNDGVAIAHLVPEDVVYTFVVTRNGRTLDTFSSVVAYCNNALIGDCTVNLRSKGSFANAQNYVNFRNVNYTTPQYDTNTRILSTQFLSLDNSAITFSINVSKFDNYGNTSLCSGQLTAPSGTVSCIIPTTFNNGTVNADLYSNGQFIGTYYKAIKVPGSQIFGNYRIILALLLLGTLPLISLGSAGVTVMMFIIGAIISGSLFLLDGEFAPGATIIWLIIAGGVLIYKMTRKE